MIGLICALLWIWSMIRCQAEPPGRPEPRAPGCEPAVESRTGGNCATPEVDGRGGSGPGRRPTTVQDRQTRVDDVGESDRQAAGDDHRRLAASGTRTCRRRPASGRPEYPQRYEPAVCVPAPTQDDGRLSAVAADSSVTSVASPASQA